MTIVTEKILVRVRKVARKGQSQWQFSNDKSSWVIFRTVKSVGKFPQVKNLAGNFLQVKLHQPQN